MGNEYFIDQIGKKVPDIYQDYAMDGSPVIKYLDKMNTCRAVREAERSAL